MKLGIVGELFEFLVKRRRFWIVPIVVVLMGMALVIVLTEGSVIAPFIYTIF